MPFNSDTSSTSRRSLLRGVTAAGAGLAAGATVGGAAAATPQGKGATRARPTAKSSDRFVTRDGTTLYYKDWGSGPAVVFCHGYPLSSDAWEDQMFHLSQNGYRVIAPDRRIIYKHTGLMTDAVRDTIERKARNARANRG